MPAADVAQAAAANPAPRAADSGTALKWTLIGGVAAFGAFAVFSIVQNQGAVRNPGGGGEPVSAPTTQGPRVRELEAALTGAVPTKPSAPVKTAPPTPAPKDADIAAWNAAQQTNTRAAYQWYLNTYPNGSFAVLVPGRISKLGDSDGNEENAWLQAREADSRADYERFL